eukprot:sb/3470970/
MIVISGLQSGIRDTAPRCGQNLVIDLSLQQLMSRLLLSRLTLYFSLALISHDVEDQGVCAGVDGCYSNPSGCTSAKCDITVQWWQDGNFTQVSLSGKLSTFSMSVSDDIWLGFGLSELGTMKDSDMYLCSKVDSQYTAVHIMGFSHGLIQSSSVQLEEEVSGSLVDGVMTCNTTIPNSAIPSGTLHIMAGMGE